MKKRAKLIIPLLWLFISLASCSKDPTVDADTGQFLGTWKVVTYEYTYEAADSNFNEMGNLRYAQQRGSYTSIVNDQWTSTAFYITSNDTGITYQDFDTAKYVVTDQVEFRSNSAYVWDRHYEFIYASRGYIDTLIVTPDQNYTGQSSASGIFSVNNGLVTMQGSGPINGTYKYTKTGGYLNIFLDGFYNSEDRSDTIVDRYSGNFTERYQLIPN